MLYVVTFFFSCALPTPPCSHLIQRQILVQIAVTLRIQIVSIHNAALLRGGKHEGADSAEHIRNDVRRGEGVHQARVLELETRIPIHLAVVEFEYAVLLLQRDNGVVLSRKDLHVKGPEYRVDLANLVHDRLT